MWISVHRRIHGSGSTKHRFRQDKRIVVAEADITSFAQTRFELDAKSLANAWPIPVSADSENLLLSRVLTADPFAIAAALMRIGDEEFVARDVGSTILVWQTLD